MTTYNTQSRTAPVSTAKVVTGTAVASVAAVAVNAAVATAALGLGASADFLPLQFTPYAALTVLGVIAGAFGWIIVRRRSARPTRVLGWLVPTVVVVSFVPDIALLAGDAMVGTSGLAVGALMLMHLVIAVIAVVTFRRVLPLPPEGSGR